MADVIDIGTGNEPPLDGKPEGQKPDAYGQAALMLAESILHALVDSGTFTAEEALAVVTVAQDVKEEVGRETNEAADRVAQSLHLLDQIATSIGTDLQ